LKDVFSYADKFIFISICTRPAKKKKNLSDGRNCHLTVKPEDWWQKKCESLVPSNVFLQTRFQNV